MKCTTIQQAKLDLIKSSIDDILTLSKTDRNGDMILMKLTTLTNHIEAYKDLMNLAYSCIIDGACEKTPITTEDAADTLANWKAEGMEGIDSITPAEFAAAWNAVVEELN